MFLLFVFLILHWGIDIIVVLGIIWYYFLFVFGVLFPFSYGIHLGIHLGASTSHLQICQLENFHLFLAEARIGSPTSCLPSRDERGSRCQARGVEETASGRAADKLE